MADAVQNTTVSCKPWPLFEVTVIDTREIHRYLQTGRSRSAVRYHAFLAYREYRHIEFRDFLRICSVKAGPKIDRLTVFQDGWC